MGHQGCAVRAPDIVLEDGTRIKNDGLLGDLMDWQEIGSWVLTGDGWFAGVTYSDMLVGLRRLIYGNLAIYVDIGSVLHFCQMYEERFHFFKDGKVEEFIECFDHFVNYVRDKYAHEHEVYGGEGTFGPPEGGFLRDGLRGARGMISRLRCRASTTNSAIFLKISCIA